VTRGDEVASRVGDEVVGGLAKETQPILHGSDTRNGTGVVTEEDTAKGGKGDHEDTCNVTFGRIGTEA
jgi:hypothetical protein